MYKIRANFVKNGEYDWTVWLEDVIGLLSLTEQTEHTYTHTSKQKKKEKKKSVNYWRDQSCLWVSSSSKDRYPNPIEPVRFSLAFYPVYPINTTNVIRFIAFDTHPPIKSKTKTETYFEHCAELLGHFIDSSLQFLHFVFLFLKSTLIISHHITNLLIFPPCESTKKP